MDNDNRFSIEKTGKNELTKRGNRVLVNFETFQKTRDLEEAEREQRIFNWQAERIVEYVKQGKLNDAEDLLIAGLLVKENATTDYERKKYSDILAKVGEYGYKNEEQELRWRLQKYLGR